MKRTDLAAMARFFEQVTACQQFLAGARQHTAEQHTCDCEIGTTGIYRQHGRCVPQPGGDVPDGRDCLTVAHLAARIQLDQLKLPVTHLSDPQLDDVVDQLAELVDRAPDLTQRRFVIELQTALRASLLPLAQPTPAPSTQETPGQ